MRRSRMLSVTVTDLTPEAFASYGEVFATRGITTRLDHVARIENGRPAARPNLFLARSGIVALPHEFTRMESHPQSSQSFAPLGDAPILVGVALRDAHGQPDLSTLRAFLARAQGFSYRAGVWHLPVASLGTPVPVLGFMFEDGTPEDCVWAEVAPQRLAG